MIENDGNLDAGNMLPPDVLPAAKINQGEISETTMTIARVNNLFTDIASYNQQFSVGSMMARSLFQFIRFDDDPEDNVQPVAHSPLSQEEDHQKMQASALAVVHGDVLNHIGLSLEPVSGKRATMYGQGEKAGEGEMRFNVANKERFTSFLGTLSPEDVRGTELRPNLETLSGILSGQVVDHYNLAEPNDDMLQLFGGLDEIIKQYTRLGIDDRAVSRLKVYLHHARLGDLREFIAIEQQGLLSQPNEAFGPSDWQIDMGPESLQRSWDNALRILQMAKDNPRAKNLYAQLRKHLQFCATYAREESIPHLRERYNSMNVHENFDIILASVQAKLADFEAVE